MAEQPAQIAAAGAPAASYLSNRIYAAGYKEVTDFGAL
jgi:hypothetical protein